MQSAFEMRLFRPTRASRSARRHRFAILSLCAVLLVTAGCGPSSGEKSAAGETGGIHLVVESRLVEPLAASLTQFTDDLRVSGYTVTVEALDASTPPLRIRDALRHQWASSPGLRGAMLIGEFGAPLFNKRQRAGDPYWHDYLVDLYYMDLEGVWEDTNGDSVLDAHRSYAGGGWAQTLSRLAERIPLGMDRREPEIWVSRIRAGTLSSLGEELSLYRDYFSRNHAYRTQTAAAPPRAFVLSALVRVTSSDWGARPAKLYHDVTVNECSPESSSPLRKFLSDSKGWALAIVGSFSGPQSHVFHSTEAEGFDSEWFHTVEGRQRIADYSLVEHKPWDVTSREIAEIRPKVFFYQVLSSETGRHDQTGYLGGAYLFFGSGLAVIAGTQHSGAIGVPVLYDELAGGRSIGDAWFQAIRWSLTHARASLTFRWCDREESLDPSVDVYKAVLLGDGTLHLPAEGASTLAMDSSAAPSR